MNRDVTFILTTEAAGIIGVAADTIRYWERTGRLRAVKTSGGVRLFARHDVEALRDGRERAALGRSSKTPDEAAARREKRQPAGTDESTS